MIKVVTWNVNSIKARLPIVIDWVKENNPDVLLLQETKTEDKNFPAMEFEDLGYNVAVVGQKSYNGVAIFAKRPIEDVLTKLPGDPSDSEARYIEAVVGNIRVASIYVPNGREVGSERFIYKLEFLNRLYARANELLTYEEAFVLGGDYNIAPADDDVYDPKAKEGALHCSQLERIHLRKIMHLGLTDAIRVSFPPATPAGRELFSWWDYRAGSWQNNEGMRIDLLVLSPQATDRLKASGIDTNPRSLPKASDHTPVWGLFN